MTRWSKRASADLRATGRFIARRSRKASEAWIERLVLRAGDASVIPLAARVVPECARTVVREVFLRSYGIVYRVDDGGIFVLTVFEGHRLMGKIDPDAVT